MKAALRLARYTLVRLALSPVGLAAGLGLVALCGALFWTDAYFADAQPTLVPLWARAVPVALALACPVLATATLVEARARDGLASLLGSPLGGREIAVGTWLAVTAAAALSTAPTLIFAVAVDWLGGVDLAAGFTGYLGALALAGLLSAASLAALARTASPAAALAIGVATCAAILAVDAAAVRGALGAWIFHASALVPLRALAEGLVAPGGLLLFAVATASLLDLCAARLEAPRLSRRARIRRAATAVLGLAAAVALNAGLSAAFDLSSQRRHSLTAASRALATRARDVSVQAYFGGVPEAQRPAQAAVERLLARYADAASGGLTAVVEDPFDASPQARRDLAAAGVRPLLWSTSVDGVPQQSQVYFHVVLSRGADRAVWQPLGRLSIDGVEAALSDRLAALVDGRREVAITTGFGAPAAPGALRAALSPRYRVRLVDLARAPAALAGADLLLVNGHRTPLSEAARDALRGAVEGGTPALILVRGMSLQRQRTVEGGPPGATQPPLLVPVEDGLGPWLAELGVGVERATIVDESDSATGAVPIDGDAVLVPALFPRARSVASAPLFAAAPVPVPFAAPLTLEAPARPFLRTSPAARLVRGVVPISRRPILRPAATPTGPFTVAAWRAEPRIAVVGSADLAGDPLASLARADARFVELAGGLGFVGDAAAWLLQQPAFTEARRRALPIEMAFVPATTRRRVKYGTTAGAAALVGASWLLGRAVRARRRRRQRADAA